MKILVSGCLVKRTTVWNVRKAKPNMFNETQLYGTNEKLRLEMFSETYNCMELTKTKAYYV